MTDVSKSPSASPPVSYAELLAGIDGIVWEADARTFQMTFVSPHAERLLGYPTSAWLGQDFWQSHMHPEDRDQAIAYCKAATQQLRMHAFDYRMIAADGRVVWLHDIVTVVAEDGRPRTLRGIMVDVTERRRVEEERAEHIRLLEGTERVNRAILAAADPETMTQGVLEVVLDLFDCHRAFLGAPCDPATASWRCEMECTRPSHPGALQRGAPVATDPEFAQLFSALLASDRPVAFGTSGVLRVPQRLAEGFDVRSVLGMVLRPPLDEPYMFGVHDCERDRVWTDGDRRLFESIGRRLADALGMLRMHRRLRDSENRFRVLVDHATDAFFLHDTDGRILDANEQACLSLGRSRDSLLGGGPHDFDVQLAPMEIGCVADRLEAGETLAFDTLHRHSDGTTFPVEVRIRPFVQNGRRYSVSLARDITDRKRAEAELRHGHDLLNAVVEGTSEAVFVKDLEGRYLLLNAAGARLLGRSVKEVLGRSDIEMAPSIDAGTTRARELEVMRSGRETTFEFSVGSGDGLRVHSSTTAPYRSAAGKLLGVVGIARDVTEARRLEEQFRQAQKMEAVGRLAGGLAHDFNNLLTVVNGCSELMAMQLAIDDPQRELAVEIQRAGERACQLTRQLLAFSRRQMLQPQTIDVHERLGDLMRLLGRLLGADVELRLERQGEPCHAHVDPAQFDQAIVNLAVNARDAMPEGGRITIRTAAVEFGLQGAPADLRPGRYVSVTVADTGAGMDVTTLARIFEPFFTTKPLGKGTGLGLAMVYGFVKQSGGHVEVHSEPGAGTTFCIHLPHADRALPVPRPELGNAVRRRGSETVLLVEDEDAVRVLTRSILQGNGYTVIEARDGLDGLRVARAHPGSIELLITDLVMPHLGGRRLAEQLRQERPDLLVLLLSGYSDDGQVVGGPPLLQKPFSPTVLLQRVRDLLDGVGVRGSTAAQHDAPASDQG